MEYKEIIQEVIQKNLGDKYISTKKLLDAGLVGVIRAHNLYFTKKRPFKFETYAKHFIKEEVIAKFIGVDRKKAEKYAKLMGYIDAAKGNVKAVLP